MPVSVPALSAKPHSRASTSGGSAPAGRVRIMVSSSSISEIPEATTSVVPPLTAARLSLIGLTKRRDSTVAATSIASKKSTEPKNHATCDPRS